MAESDNNAFTTSISNTSDLTDNVAIAECTPVPTSDENAPVDLLKENRRLQIELDEARSLVAVANYSLEESIETERRKCQEEVATLQQLMKGIYVFLAIAYKRIFYNCPILNNRKYTRSCSANPRTK